MTNPGLSGKNDVWSYLPCFYDVWSFLYKKQTCNSKSVFYPSRRLGISSRVSVYIIKGDFVAFASHHGNAVYIISCGLMRYNSLRN